MDFQQDGVGGVGAADAEKFAADHDVVGALGNGGVAERALGGFLGEGARADAGENGVGFIAESVEVLPERVGSEFGVGGWKIRIVGHKTRSFLAG